MPSLKKDPDVKVLYDDDNNEIRLYVSDSDKAKALSELFPVEKTFGEVKLKITIIPANGASFGFRTSNFPTVQAALKNNPHCR